MKEIKEHIKKNLLKNSTINSSKDFNKFEKTPQKGNTFQKDIILRQKSTNMTVTPNKNVVENPNFKKKFSVKNKSETSKQINEYFANEEKSNLNSILNQTDLNSELKTSQIKVIARFRPINFVEEVYILIT